MSNIEKAKKMELPLPPWTLEDPRATDEKGKRLQGLVSRYGEEEGKRLYFTLARELGYFNPKGESGDYRPALDPTPFLDIIREQHSKKKKE